MNPDTNTQPGKKQEPSVSDDNSVNTPVQNVQIGNQEQSTQDPSSVGQQNSSSPVEGAEDNNYANSAQQPVIGDETNVSAGNNQINQVDTQPPDYTIIGMNTPSATNTEQKSGRLIGRKRILYIFTASIACLVIISGAVFGLVSTNKKPQTSSNVASKADSNTQNKSSSQTQPNNSNTSNTVASNSSNATSVKKSASANPVLPFSSEKEDTVPANNNVPESDPTPEPGDPVTEPDDTDSQP